MTKIRREKHELVELFNTIFSIINKKTASNLDIENIFDILKNSFHLGIVCHARLLLYFFQNKIVS